MFKIGIDIGGTNIAVGLLDPSGVIVNRKSVKTPPGGDPRDIIKSAAETCLSCADAAAINMSMLESVGIGIPGIVNPESGIARCTGNLNFSGFNIYAEMRKYINLPVYAANDANAAAFGEYLLGSAAGYKTSVTITLGTGIGGGIIIDGKIYHGKFFGAGEIGHHIIAADGEKCACGKRGCWEAYASASALIRDAKKASEENPGCKILKLAGCLDNINAKIVFDAEEQDDPVAARLVSRYIKFVAVGISNIICLLEPEIVLIGGGVSEQGGEFLARITGEVTRQIYGGVLNTRIALAKLGNTAGIIGAAMLGTAVKIR